MDNSKPDIKFKPKLNPLVASLPEHLKNPANFEKYNQMILNTFISTCNHTDIHEWAMCEKCTNKMLDRRKLLKKLGFKNPAQYMAWKKIHEEIKTRMPLVDWKAEKLMI